MRGARLDPTELKRGIRRKIAATKLTGRRTALKLGWLDGHTGYTRFVILGRSRTGTNMVRSSIDQHSRGVCYGELFRLPGRIGWDRWPFVGPRSGQSRRLVKLAKRDPIRFLESWIFGAYDRRVGAVGFKMFYYYGHGPEWGPLWTWLEQEEAIHVLHIRRHNLLRTYLSHIHASRSEEWIAKGDTVRSPPPVGLDFDACRSFFEKTRRWETEYEYRFSDHPKLDLYYEDVVRDFDAEMSRVQTFLGLPLEGLRPRTRKQSRLPLAKAILNYEEIRERFANTEWDSFFDDPSAEPAVATAVRETVELEQP